MKKGFLFLIMCFCIGIVHAHNDRNLLLKKIDEHTLKTQLLLNQTWVKYPHYTDRSGWNKLTDSRQDFLIKEGEKYLKYKWQVIPASTYIDYKRTGDRQSMQTPQNENNKAIASLLLAELAEGKGRFIDQLINGVFQSCEMTSWVLSAHVVVQKTRSSLPNHNEQIIDLVSGDMGSLLSWVYYFMKDEFDKVEPYVSERLRMEIQNKILTPYLERNDFWWMALNENRKNTLVNNWNPWCNSNVLQCFLLLENDPETLAKAVYKTMTSVDKFINYVKEDGACEEGPAYWGHAAGKLYDYLQVLSDGTGGQVSLFNEPLVKKMGEYISRSYVGNDWVVNFADASARMEMDSELIYRYGKAVNSDEMKQFAAYIKVQNSNVAVAATRDMLRNLENLYVSEGLKNEVAGHNNPIYTYYPQTEFLYIKKENVFLAAKGGFNDESHNHNDVGTFSLYINNNPIFIDAGVGTYTRQTFSGERYSIWSMQSDYHNLPRINGYSQAYGKKYKAENTRLNEKQSKFTIDIAKAYPDEASVNKWERSYQLKNKEIVIEDIFEIDGANQENQVNFLSRGSIDIAQKGIISIVVGSEKVALFYDKDQFIASIETIKLDDSRFIKVWGSEIYRISLNASSISAKGKYKFTIRY